MNVYLDFSLMLEKNQWYLNYVFLLVFRRGGEWITCHQQSEINPSIFAAFQATKAVPSDLTWPLEASGYPP